MNEKENYQELLKNPLWIGKRNEILSRDKNTCQMCGAKDKYMHVHHNYYIRGRKPWEYDDSTLITLCEDCHSYIHNAFVNELNGIKLGDIYGRYHSDWHNTGVVYAIDGLKKLVYILESDDGVSDNEFYNTVVELADFKNKYQKEPNVEDWNYLFTRWFATMAIGEKVPLLFKMNFMEIVLTNTTLMQIINHTINY